MGTIILKVTVSQIQHTVWQRKEWSSASLHPGHGSVRSSPYIILTHLFSTYGFSTRLDHLSCFKLFLSSKQVVISFISSIVSWPATPTKTWRIASKRHIKCLLHISIFSQKAAEKGMCFLWCFWKISPNQEANRSEYNSTITLTLDLNIDKKNFLNHCCSPPLMEWTHNKNGKQNHFCKINWEVWHAVLFYKNQKGFGKKKIMEGRRKANESQFQVTATLKISQAWVQITVPNEVAKEFKSKQCEGWVHCNTWAIIGLHLQIW